MELKMTRRALSIVQVTVAAAFTAAALIGTIGISAHSRRMITVSIIVAVVAGAASIVFRPPSIRDQLGVGVAPTFQVQGGALFMRIPIPTPDGDIEVTANISAAEREQNTGGPMKVGRDRPPRDVGAGRAAFVPLALGE